MFAFSEYKLCFLFYEFVHLLPFQYYKESKLYSKKIFFRFIYIILNHKLDF